jgi:hypothetical protein
MTQHLNGILCPKGDELAGLWQVSGGWSGNFMILRKTPAFLALTEIDDALPISDKPR